MTTPFFRLPAFFYRAWRYRLGRDREQIRLLLRYLRPGMTSVDVGAHKGAYTYWMSRAVGAQGRVVAFEPQPELVELLTTMLAGDQVHVEAMGLSSQPGVTTLHIPGDGSPSPGATLEMALLHGTTTQLESLRVETLDRYFPPNGEEVHLIKCDVKGHELAVFQGGKELLTRCRPLLMFECEARHLLHHDMADVFIFLENLGYQGKFFLSGELYPLDHFRAEMQQDPRQKNYVNNFIFTHRQSRRL